MARTSPLLRRVHRAPRPLVHAAASNDTVWTNTVAEYATYDSWTDRGERRLVHQIAAEVRNTPILDVGVGAGRSAWLLRLLSADYVGIDLNEGMVQTARALLPDVDLRTADASDLSMFEDDRFGLVFFSHAGLDAIDHERRARALSEFARVARPGGYIAYSTLNRHGPFWHSGPGPVGPAGHRPRPYNYGRFIARVTLHPRRHAQAVRNANRLRRLAVDHGDWGTDTMPTHNWALLVHYVSADAALREVELAGLEPVGLIGDNGRDVDRAHPDPQVRWFHVLARKPAALTASGKCPGGRAADARHCHGAQPSAPRRR